jgi:hypothetical protein
MIRSISSAALILAVFTVRANAIEMFTNFHNGENVGLPPMEVPISMYPGFGRGGWAPGVIGAPLRTAPPVPTMSPTGQAPAIFHRGANWNQSGAEISERPMQTYLFAKNGRRMRMNNYNPVISNGARQSAPQPASDTAPPKSITVLKPQEDGAPPNLGQSLEPQPTPAISVGHSDDEASAFFQSATSGW